MVVAVARRLRAEQPVAVLVILRSSPAFRDTAMGDVAPADGAPASERPASASPGVRGGARRRDSLPDHRAVFAAMKCS